MKGKELILNTINRQNRSATAFWVGHPTDEAKEKYYAHFGIAFDEESEEETRRREASTVLANRSGKADILFSEKVQSDVVWLSPEVDLRGWKHPEGKPMWDCLKDNERHSLSQAGRFAETTDVAEVEAFDWPNPDYLDFAPVLDDVKYAHSRGIAIFGGMWCPFFHVACDFFGMENYFMKLYTDPKVVHAVTAHIVEFYLEANRRCLEAMGGYLTAGFFGNDLGSQLNTLVSPDKLDEFVFSYGQKIVDQVKGAGLKVAMHSCGAISRIIPRMIDMGIDILHPLQAMAVGMDAESLKQYKNDIIFMGGIDTQSLLPFGSPQMVRDQVRRVKDILGPGLIVSPSHEALLPNVPVENVMAMSEAAKEA